MPQKDRTGHDADFIARAIHLLQFRAMLRLLAFQTARMALLRPLISRHRTTSYYRAICGNQPVPFAEQQLELLLQFVQKHNQYYRPLLAGGRLSSLPMLTKDIIRARFEELRSSRPPARGTYLNTSGGSSGEPICVVQDQEYADWSAATEEYFYKRFLNVDPERERKVILWGSPRDLARVINSLPIRLHRWATYSKWLDAYRVSPEIWQRYIEEINAFRPVVIKGYAGSLWQISRFIMRGNIKIHRPRCIYSSAETLDDRMRRDIEEAFQAKVHDFYGSREVGAIAGECRAGRRHVFVFNNMVEVFDRSAEIPLPPGKSGRLIISNLHNYSMPILRYDIGDVGEVKTDPCPCGSTLPWLAGLRGRANDFLQTKDGRMVSSCLVTGMFTDCEWIEQFRVEQLDYDRVIVWTVPFRRPLQNDIEHITYAIRNALGDECRVDWKLVEHIPRVGQGKHAFVRNLIPAAGACRPLAAAGQ